MIDQDTAALAFERLLATARDAEQVMDIVDAVDPLLTASLSHLLRNMAQARMAEL